jgi:HSP20 family protein
MMMRAEWMRYGPFDESHPITQGLRRDDRVRLIPVDAYRRGDEFKAHLDMPGMDPGSIELAVEGNVLAVRGKRRWMRAEGDQIQAMERFQGECGRQLFLGEWLDRDAITAGYDDGVLTITIPVSQQSKLRKIEVAHVGGVTADVEAALGPLTEPALAP